MWCQGDLHGLSSPFFSVVIDVRPCSCGRVWPALALGHFPVRVVVMGGLVDNDNAKPRALTDKSDEVAIMKKDENKPSAPMDIMRRECWHDCLR